MTATDHRKILVFGFAIFSAIFAFTFLLLMLVSLGVFVALGISLWHESGDNNQAGVGILGGVLAVVFYCLMGLVFVLPTASASWKIWKHKRHARVWGIIAAIVLLPMMPLGTALGVYGLWFLFSVEGRQLFSR
jgi:hypothetical protein